MENRHLLCEQQNDSYEKNTSLFKNTLQNDFFNNLQKIIYFTHTLKKFS